MNTIENSISSTDNHPNTDGRKQSPPAFLDLADSSARLGTNLPDMSARVELKRIEHERQRAMQRKLFEDQMRVLEQQQAQELLSIPFDATLGASIQHVAVSAPTTPPRVSATLNGDLHGSFRSSRLVDAESLSKAVGTVADKRKSVTYAPTVNLSPDLSGSGSKGFSRAAGAKSMPASRRTSASSHDEEIASHLQNLSLIGERSNRASPIPGNVPSSIMLRPNSRFNDEGAKYASTYNAGLMLDEQLDQEMNNAMRHLPTSDDDKFVHSFGAKTSSAALDLAHISQTSPRTHFSNRVLDSREKSSEWPQFSAPRGTDNLAVRSDRRTVTNPSDEFNGAKLSVAISASPLIQQHSQGLLPPGSRRGSPPSLLDSLSVSATTRSVPATPLGMPNTAVQLLKNPGTPLLQDNSGLSHRLSTPGLQIDNVLNAADLQASLSRAQSQFDQTLGYNSLQSTSLEDYTLESVYGLGGGLNGSLGNGLDGSRLGGYGFDSASRTNGAIPSTTGSTALYNYNGSRFGLLGGRPSIGGSVDGKMNGLHGPKHKRGDIDREYNRFTGTRLEDLQGDIPALCKDQHGCRYLQKKLEEGVPEHRDMIFRETFGHFADLMTDPFGNYLCQKLLEFSTDEQRNLICESVAQDLVNISLNMHGTRAVQKMIDFLSTRRQTDPRYDAQIHSIIVALSLHVVVLIKDLNGNHVIQKCLNKLAPDDNQFIYNAVAANCVEVATHRHGCCVLQRCIDHASDAQRVQLVNEITYNALTLVQDPYGNYVVQYILDLNDNRFSDAVIRQFQGNVCALSVQKFSSNVIEKCVRVAEHSTRKLLIDELLNRSRLEKLLRDSYGNYCVQTALDYAEPGQRALLVEGIRPVLPLIRNTPYGKRIQNKLQRLGAQQGGSNRHIPQPLHGQNPLTDVYGAQNGLYPIQQATTPFGQSHLTSQLHALQPQSMDGYSSLGAGHANGFSAAGFPIVNHFGAAGLASTLADPYQRSAFGYGM